MMVYSLFMMALAVVDLTVSYSVGSEWPRPFSFVIIYLSK
jgi:hypothetical protein